MRHLAPMLSAAVHWRSALRAICWWLPLILLCNVATSHAQYRFDSWTTEDGLPQNSVNAILQTRDGYLWLGTFGGLTRFDGVKFTIFNTGNTPGLKSNRILSFAKIRNR